MGRWGGKGRKKDKLSGEMTWKYTRTHEPVCVRVVNINTCIVKAHYFFCDRTVDVPGRTIPCENIWITIVKKEEIFLRIWTHTSWHTGVTEQ